MNEHEIPLKASITERSKDRTITTLDLFGKKVSVGFAGENHLECSVSFVKACNTHFKKEWTVVRRANAAIVEELIDVLRELNVDTETLNMAVERMKERAEA